jgi:hypothetical protein
VCDCVEKYAVLMLLRANRAAEICVNKLKDSIEMYIKVITPVIARSENKLLNCIYYSLLSKIIGRND